MHNVLWGVLLLVVWPFPAQANVLDEIRMLLQTQSLVAPSEDQLGGLQVENLADQLNQIDPYARFLTLEEVNRQRLLSGKSGIGAELFRRGDRILLSIYQEGGAHEAGIADHSRLLAIDGQAIDGLSLQTIAEKLLGEPGSLVRLAVVTPEGRPQSVTVRRMLSSPPEVELLGVADVQVLRIRDFRPGTTRAAVRAVLDFRLAGKSRFAPESELIIDLRDAPGGDLYEAFDLAALFLPPGSLLGWIRGRDPTLVPIRAPQSTPAYSLPLFLLVGPETASAAEIFAGILQRHGRARLIGQPTFGKCSSQTEARLSDGSVFRYTNKEVVFIDKTTCTTSGLIPDMSVGDDDVDILWRLLDRVRHRRRGMPSLAEDKERVAHFSFRRDLRPPNRFLSSQDFSPRIC